MSQSTISQKKKHSKSTEISNQFSEEWAQTQAFDLLLKYPRLHLATYVHRTAEGRMLSFDDNQWQQKLYMENADKIVIMKSSKLGISEWLIADLFIQAKLGLNGMYILPDQPIRNRFISSRVDKIIGNTPEYLSNVVTKKKDVNAKSLKTIYGKTWAFVGANNPATFYEFNYDINIYDEYDKCNPISLETATDRTLGSKRDRWRKVGNPTISGYGISDEYEKSCQYRWLVKCWRCCEWQEMDWFTHFVNQEDSNVFTLKDKSDKLDKDAKGYCIKCGKAMDRLGHGKWIAKYPDREIKGYHATRLFVSIARDRLTVREDFAKMQDCLGDPSLMQWFYNNRLGVPYEADGSKLTEALLAECVGADYVMPSSVKDGTVIGGADIGAKIHLQASKIVDGKRQKVCIESFPLNMELFEQKCKQYNITRGVVDALPETKFVKDFIKRNPGWYRCFYGKQDNPNISLNINHKERKVNVGRTESLDASMAAHINHDLLIPKNFMSIDGGDYAKQMIASTRVYEEKSERFIWDEGNKADHHRHADNYENIAFDIFIGSGKNVSVS